MCFVARLILVAFCFASPASAATQSLVGQGEELFNAGKYGQAKEIFERVLILDSKDAQASYFMGRIYIEFEDYDTAKEHLEKAVKFDEGNIDFHLWLATVYRQKTRTANFLSASKWAGKWKAELERAVEIDLANIEARKRLINYYLNAPAIGGGDKDKGKRLAEETIGIDEIQGRLLLARAHHRMNEMELAVVEYQNVLVLDPENASAHNSLGYIFLEREEYDLAKFHFSKYVEVASEDPNAFDSMGDYYLEREMFDDAAAQYLQALELDPKFSASRFKLAQTFEKSQMNEDAIYHYSKLLELTPAHPKAKDAKKRLKALKK
jgi:tetratricopeptide (TPR) repeat protein